jgi:hypothetical protein
MAIILPPITILLILPPFSHVFSLTLFSLEILVHRLPKPPPSGPSFAPTTEYPYTVIDLSTYKPFTTTSTSSSINYKKYVVTLCSICSSGEIVVHLHHMKCNQTKATTTTTTINNDLIDLNFNSNEMKNSSSSSSSSISSSSSSSSSSNGLLVVDDISMPSFILMSFDVNGRLNSFWCKLSFHEIL